ncbi:hypothetical protein ACGFYY_37915 [Streptomyces sp. NPDC048331]|uniref:hypothetical protein n=1 Tax=Streptomyces sp. NPDC048331 TaxID=3365534 RepID=UPI003724B90B
MFDRFAIDDGRHIPQIVIDEDASTAAGTARFRAECSCGRLTRAAAGTRDQATAAHLAHAESRLAAARGPARLPLGTRTSALVAAMLAIWALCYATGATITGHYGLTGTTAKAVLAGSHLAGLALGFGLMVAARRFIAPTR